MSRSQDYSMEDRERAVAAYVVGGTYSKAETLTGINQTTIRKWRERDPSWWEAVEHKIRLEHEQEHRAKIREIVVDGLNELHDRIKHGDIVLDKEGNEVRRKMPGKDLNIATGTMIDKLRVSLGQATSIASKADTVADKLNALRTAARDAAKEQAKEEGKLVEMGREEHLCVTTKTPESEIAA
jgi:hypothetical protein